jgi:hypothetical protein
MFLPSFRDSRAVLWFRETLVAPASRRQFFRFTHIEEMPARRRRYENLVEKYGLIT